MKCDLQQISWSPELESGLEAIDRQHHQLLRLLEKMSGSPDLAGNSELFCNLLHEFSEIANRHFEFEEALLEKLNYEHLEGHKQSHESLLQQLAEVSMTTTFDTDKAPADFVDMLCEWFENHLSEEDTQYFGVIRQSLIHLST